MGQALVCIENHVQRKPDHFLGRILYANILADLRRFSDAESVLSQLDLATTNKSNWAVCSAWTRLYQTKGDYENAVVWARRLIDARPDWSVGYIYLGSSLARLGRFEEAVAAYLPATQLPADNNNDPDEAYLNIAYIRRAQRRFDETLAALAHAIKIDPDYDLHKTVRDDVLAAVKLQIEIDQTKADTGHPT